MDEDLLKNLSSAISKVLNKEVDIKDVKFIDPHGLPTEEDWNLLKERMENEIHGYSEVIIDTDSANFRYGRVRFNTDKEFSEELLHKIGSMEGLICIEKGEDFIDAIADFCPKCNEEIISKGIGSMNMISYILEKPKAIEQLMGV